MKIRRREIPPDSSAPVETASAWIDRSANAVLEKIGKFLKPLSSGFRRQKFERTEDRSACGVSRREMDGKPSARIFCPLSSVLCPLSSAPAFGYPLPPEEGEENPWPFLLANAMALGKRRIDMS
jgi:hypothetical protein